MASKGPVTSEFINREDINFMHLFTDAKLPRNGQCCWSVSHLHERPEASADGGDCAELAFILQGGYDAMWIQLPLIFCNNFF